MHIASSPIRRCHQVKYGEPLWKCAKVICYLEGDEGATPWASCVARSIRLPVDALRLMRAHVICSFGNSKKIVDYAEKILGTRMTIEHKLRADRRFLNSLLRGIFVPI